MVEKKERMTKEAMKAKLRKKERRASFLIPSIAFVKSEEFGVEMGIMDSLISISRNKDLEAKLKAKKKSEYKRR